MKEKYKSLNLRYIYRISLITIVVIFIFCSLSIAKDLTFTWLSSDEDIIGYRLYYKTGPDPSPPYDGTGISEGNSPIEIGNITIITVTGLTDDETYHFALTKFNEYYESDFSEVITVAPKPVPIILDIRMSN